MFETALKEKLKAIFEFDKVTFDSPAESTQPGSADAFEQEGMFIEVESPHVKITDKRAKARVTGKIRVLVNSEKMPFGYFAKKIASADPELTTDIFFSDIENSAGKLQNLDERSISFVYFFNSEYDPNLGTITSIDITVGET